MSEELKPVSKNKFQVICKLLQSLDYALMLTCTQATVILKIKCKLDKQDSSITLPVALQMQFILLYNYVAVNFWFQLIL